MSDSSKNIPFNKPKLAGRELEYIQRAVDNGRLSGDGEFTMRCQLLLENQGVAKKTLLTHSCTGALEMAMILADIGPGDEVIMPSYTFVSTANAACLRGAVPVFVDIDQKTLCMDPSLVSAAITPKTRAIVAVHYAGFVYGMRELRKICDQNDLVLIEDAAQALGSTFDGRPAGSFGDLSAFSFHETKNIISGEGGFLGINKDSLMERAEIIREKGTNRTRYFRGEVDKYTWVDIGSSYLPGELISAFLLSQLENIERINAHRIQAWEVYDHFFSALKMRSNLTLPSVPDGCIHNGHMYFLIMESADQRTEFIDHMRSHSILAPFHYVPLHSSPAGMRLGRTHGLLSVTDSVSETLVRLPLYQISNDEQSVVLNAASKFFT